VRRTLLSAAVAFAGAACVTASGWALQAGALPPPRPATRVAADASAWFHDYRLVVDVFHVDHRRLMGACLRGWFPRPHRPKARASLLSLGAGPLRMPDKRHPWLAAARRGSGPNRLLAFVGCSGKLASVLGAAAQSGDHLSTERSFAANQPAVALEVKHGKDERLTLFVSPRTYRPLVAFADLEGRQATARLYLSRLQSGLLGQFHLIPQGRAARP
jgi:hypothetical protein